MIVDKDEVTLVLPADKWRYFRERLPDYREATPYRLITFDLPLDLNMVGFMARVSQILANAGVPLLTLGAFERDHILVPDDSYTAALEALVSAQS